MKVANLVLRCGRLRIDGQNRPRCACGKVVINAHVSRHPENFDGLVLACPSCGACFGTIGGLRVLFGSLSPPEVTAVARCGVLAASVVAPDQPGGTEAAPF